MRWPVLHYHSAVAAGLILLLSVAMPGILRAEPGLLLLHPAQSQPLPKDELAPDFGGEDPQSQDDGTESDSPQLEVDEAAPADATSATRLRDREDLDMLFAELAQADGETWARAETDILRIWSRSGSAAMDLLYKKGEAALDAGDSGTAIGHLTALTDHAPDFAGGWYLRGVAFYLDGDIGPAIADMGEVLKREPRHFGALTQLGTMLEELSDDEGALKAYRASLKIHPHQQDATDAVTRLEQKNKGTDA